MSSTSQKALIISSEGASLALGTCAIPKPGPGQVLIKIHSAALNPVDNYLQRFIDSYPVVAGQDGAGTVEELGQDAAGVQIGDRVLFQSVPVPDRGTFQQYALADAIRVAKIPNKYSFDDAATLPVGFATAAIGLYGKPGVRRGVGFPTSWSDAGRNKYKGQTALVIGGSSSVGQFAIQLLRLSGFGPIITTASSRNAEYAQAAGATHIIDYTTTSYVDLRTAVAKITSAPVTLVYDAISSPESEKAGWAVLAPEGSIVVTRVPVVGEDGKVAEDGKLLAHVYGSSNAPNNHEIGNDIYAQLTGLLESGAVRPNKVEVLSDGLSGIFSGLDRLAQWKVSGVKLVAHPQETV